MDGVAVGELCGLRGGEVITVIRIALDRETHRKYEYPKPWLLKTLKENI